MRTTIGSRFVPALIAAALALGVLGGTWYIAAGHEASGDGHGAGGQWRDGTVDPGADGAGTGRGNGGSGNGRAGSGGSGNGRAGAGGDADGDGDVVLPPADPDAVLSPAQADDLRLMAEEEKLALDLYTALGVAYSRRAWDNVAASEARHLEEIRLLLARYGLPDPTATTMAGTFASEALQAMFDALLAEGLTGEAGALAAGIAVELDDIARLDAAMAAADQTDIDTVYASLRAGSVRHLATFERLRG